MPPGYTYVPCTSLVRVDSKDFEDRNEVAEYQDYPKKLQQIVNSEVKEISLLEKEDPNMSLKVPNGRGSCEMGLFLIHKLRNLHCHI